MVSVVGALVSGRIGCPNARRVSRTIFLLEFVALNFAECVANSGTEIRTWHIFARLGFELCSEEAQYVGSTRGFVNTASINFDKRCFVKF